MVARTRTRLTIHGARVKVLAIVVRSGSQLWRGRP